MERYMALPGTRCLTANYLQSVILKIRLNPQGRKEGLKTEKSIVNYVKVSVELGKENENLSIKMIAEIKTKGNRKNPQYKARF